MRRRVFYSPSSTFLTPHSIGLASSFFDFEIEEDDFKKDFSAKIKAALAKFTAARDQARIAQPVQRKKTRRAKVDNYVVAEESARDALVLEPNKTKSKHSAEQKKNALRARRPQSMGQGVVQPQGGKDVRYRIIKTPSAREGTKKEAFDGEWKSERKSETDLKAEIREAMARVRKQKKLKQYYEEKARRDEEVRGLCDRRH